MHLEPVHFFEIQRILTFWAPGIPAYAFGSRVHGQRLKPTSDLDICLKGSDAINAKILRQVRDAFEISDLPFRVDVTDWHAASAEFRDEIARHLELIPAETGTHVEAAPLSPAFKPAG
jgi:uncharacterized protein